MFRVIPRNTGVPGFRVGLPEDPPGFAVDPTALTQPLTPAAFSTPPPGPLEKPDPGPGLIPPWFERDPPAPGLPPWPYFELYQPPSPPPEPEPEPAPVLEDPAYTHRLQNMIKRYK
jgi:hypothetical protein